MDQGQYPSYQFFAEHLNALFQISIAADKVVEVKLVEVSELKLSPHQERYSIVFKGPRDTFLLQDNYSMTHETGGTFSIFLVPVGMEGDGYLYESVSNQLLAAEGK
ncbi:MAG: hypothetical protein QOD75_2884 [Blastocatellia bacterium]|jgi:hypothetical protein|nr:hypothetical protein [Blastocatellia bacterium]